MTNHATTPATKPATTTPPTTPPAIAPVFELLLDELVEDDAEVCGTIDGLALVEVGTIEAVPVTSGESLAVSGIHETCMFVDGTTHRQQAPRLKYSNCHQSTRSISSV
jgi:hypothetical protein